MAGTIRIAILANAAQARAEIGSVGTSAEGIGAKFSKMRAPAVAVLGAIGVGAAKSVKSASDLNETINKSQAVFGSSFTSIDKWSQGSAKAFGLSREQALSATAAFGDQYQQMGLNADQAAKLSTSNVQLAADLGSFSNLPTADVLDSIAAANRGEFDSLQRVIPGINAARVQHEAMVMSGKKTVGALTDQDKALAINAIIAKDGAKAQGDFAKTQNGAANQSKIAAASAADLGAKLGQVLLPAYATAVGLLSQFVAFLGQHQQAVQVVIGGVAALAAIILVVSAAQTIATTAMTVARGAVVAYTAVQWLLNAAMTANPIGIIVVGVALLIAGFILLYKKSETFRNILSAIGKVGLSIWSGIKTAALAVWSFITGYVRLQITVITAVIKGVVAVAKAVWNAIRSAATSVWNGIKSLVVGQINLMKTGINALRTAAVAVWNAIKGAATSAWNGVKNGFSLAVNSIKAGFGRIKSFGSDVLSKIRSLFSGSALVSAGARLMSGLARGIAGAIGKAVDAVRRGVQRIKDMLPGSPIRSGPLVGWNRGGAGKRLMGFLAYGIDQGASEVKTSMANALDPARGLGSITVGGRATVAPAQTITVTVQAGVGDPVAIGKAVSGYLNTYRQAGGRK